MKITQESLRKVSLFVVFLVCIFPYSDWILRDTSYLSVFSPNTENTEQKNSEYGHFLRIESSCFTTLLNAFFIWSLTSSFESRSIPKCFSIPNWLTLAPLHVKEGWFWLLKLFVYWYQGWNSFSIGKRRCQFFESSFKLILA